MTPKYLTEQLILKQNWITYLLLFKAFIECFKRKAKRARVCCMFEATCDNRWIFLIHFIQIVALSYFLWENQTQEENYTKQFLLARKIEINVNVFSLSFLASIRGIVQSCVFVYSRQRHFDLGWPKLCDIAWLATIFPSQTTQNQLNRK